MNKRYHIKKFALLVAGRSVFCFRCLLTCTGDGLEIVHQHRTPEEFDILALAKAPKREAAFAFGRV